MKPRFSRVQNTRTGLAAPQPAPPRPSQRGQALILIVFAIVALFGITALAVDGGNSYNDRRHAQSAADSAALAGALARINGEQWVDKINQVAASNGYGNHGSQSAVEIHSPPISGPYKGNIEYIQVRITSRVRTYFASVVGVSQMTNTVESVARSKPPVFGPLFGGAGVVALAPTSDCLLNKSFYVHAEATLAIYNTGMIVNSNNPSCAIIQQGEGSIRVHDNNEIQVVGGFNIQKPQLLTPYPPVSGMVSIPYPPPVYMPKIGCAAREATVSEDGSEITPGNWGSEDFPPLGVHTLDSGVYCIDGDFVILGAHEVEGAQVVIYMKGGQVRWSGAATIKLSAPNKGDLAGLLIYQPKENQNPLILNAGEDSHIRGTILAPGAQIRIKGNDSEYGFHGQLIGYTFDVDGDSNVIIRFDPEDSYKAWTMPEVQFTK